MKSQLIRSVIKKPIKNNAIKIIVILILKLILLLFWWKIKILNTCEIYLHESFVHNMKIYFLEENNIIMKRNGTFGSSKQHLFWYMSGIVR